MRGGRTNILVLGSGGHSGVLIDILEQLDVELLGILDNSRKIGSKCFGLEVIGNDDYIDNFSHEEVILVNGIGSLPGRQERWLISEKFREKGFEFMTLVHPNASLTNNISIGNGVQIMNGSVVQHGTHIGCDSIINTGSIIDHNCTIGNSCHIAPGTVLSGGVTIGNNVHIGTGSCIIQNIKIGDNVTVAAGSVIYKDIEPNTRYILGK